MRIAVIGGGPGGLFAAIEAAKGGAEVSLFDQGIIGKNIICGECIFDFFGIMPKTNAGLLRAVENMVVKVIGNYVQPVKQYNRMWMIDRSAWQRDLKNRAIAYGVKIFEQQKITVSQFKKMQQEFDWLIDASGAPSISGKVFAFTNQYLEKFSVAWQYELEADFSYLDKSIYIRFLPDVPAENMSGYFWIFPKTAKLANVGIGYAVGKNRRTIDIKQKFTQVLQAEGLAEAKVIKSGGGFLPNKILPQLQYQNVLLVGDAAGITSALSGEGIDLACISGALAAQAIINNTVDEYGKKLRKLLMFKHKTEKSFINIFKNSEFAEFEEFCQAFCNKKIWPLNKMVFQAGFATVLLWKWLRHKPAVNPFKNWETN